MSTKDEKEWLKATELGLRDSYDSKFWSIRQNDSFCFIWLLLFVIILYK